MVDLQLKKCLLLGIEIRLPALEREEQRWEGRGINTDREVETEIVVVGGSSIMEVEIDAIDSIDLNEQNFLSIFSGKSV